MTVSHEMSVRAVVFDLDGTLLDTLEDVADAVNHALVELACPTHPIDRYRTLLGDGAPTLIRRALPPERVEALYDEAFLLFRRYYADHSQDKTRPYPGIAELLDQLTARRLPMAVVSNKPHEPARELVAAVLGRWRFCSVAGHREGVPKKPHPAMALEAARAAGAAAEACLFVGDSDVDIRTALAAAMIPVGVSWGFRGVEELEAAGAAAVIDEPLALLALLGERPCRPARRLAHDRR